ncbi:hypothetical protein TWF696_005853 [Orbilia brochopaga]|uniref:Uncharacterized protein n=1 Tax=Orbilia brochopaga TaxID=3140254 RepID=A0AAV9UV21_9PEZI
MYLMELWITYGVLAGIAIGISGTAAVEAIMHDLEDRKRRIAMEIQLYGRRLTRKERKWLKRRQHQQQMGVAVDPFPPLGCEPGDAKTMRHSDLQRPTGHGVPQGSVPPAFRSGDGPSE